MPRGLRIERDEFDALKVREQAHHDEYQMRHNELEHQCEAMTARYDELQHQCQAAMSRLEDVDLVMTLLGAVRAASVASEARLDTLAATEERHGKEQQALAGRIAPVEARLFGFGSTLEQLQRDVDALSKRQQFIRAEALFELRTALEKDVGPRSQSWNCPSSDARFITRQRIDALTQRGPLKVNVGCGHIAMPEYVNIDVRELPSVDVVADASRLPFPESTLAEIYSSHLLEHFPGEHLRRVILPHWVSKLRHGGKLVTVVPDPEAMISDYAGGAMSWEDLREVLYGLQKYEGDFHFSMFSRNELEVVMEQAGVDQLRWEFTGRKNGKCRDMSLTAIKR